jgi:hypothetical protein
MKMAIERILVVFNGDQTIKGIAVYGENGNPVDATIDEVDALIQGAGVAKEIEILRKQIDALTSERDALKEQISISPTSRPALTTEELLAGLIDSGALSATARAKLEKHLAGKE